MAAGSNQSQGWRVWPLKWASIAAVIIGAVMVSRLTPHEMAVRFILVAGSMAVMLPLLHNSQVLLQELQPCTAE